MSIPAAGKGKSSSAILLKNVKPRGPQQGKQLAADSQLTRPVIILLLCQSVESEKSTEELAKATIAKIGVYLLKQAKFIYKGEKSLAREKQKTKPNEERLLELADDLELDRTLTRLLKLSRRILRLEFSGGAKEDVNLARESRVKLLEYLKVLAITPGFRSLSLNKLIFNQRGERLDEYGWGRVMDFIAKSSPRMQKPALQQLNDLVEGAFDVTYFACVMKRAVMPALHLKALEPQRPHFGKIGGGGIPTLGNGIEVSNTIPRRAP